MQNHLISFTLTLILSVFLISCGPTPQIQMAIPNLPSARSASSASTAVSLPPTAHVDARGLSLLEVVFRTQLNVNRLDDLYATTRGKVDNISVVSNCNLDVLKGFVTTGWAPVVFLHAAGRRLWAVVGYDEREIQVENPISRAIRTMTQSDFEKQWTTGSGQKCVLITPGQLSGNRVHFVLGKYLPPNQVTEVKVRSR